MLQRGGFIIVLHWLFQEVDDEVDVGDVVDVFGVVHACCSSSSILPFLSYLLTRVWIRSIIVIIIQYYAGLHRHLRTLSWSLFVIIVLLYYYYIYFDRSLFHRLK